MTINPKKSELANLTEALAKTAVILAGEPAWKRDNALEVIKYLKMQKLAVIGVEYWHQINQKPKWLATSNYECDIKDGWGNYIQCCAIEAIEFVSKFSNDSEAIFNLTWINEAEYTKLTRHGTT